MSECIEWDGYRDHRGYGRRGTREAVRKYGTVLLHRQVWIDACGPIAPGLVVMHLCDNPACYRIEHLAVGTQAENLADMRRKGRARNGNEGKTQCPHGHPLSGENVYVTRRGGRWCRECGRRRARDRQRRYRAQGRAAA